MCQRHLSWTENCRLPFFVHYSPLLYWAIHAVLVVAAVADGADSGEAGNGSMDEAEKDCTDIRLLPEGEDRGLLVEESMSKHAHRYHWAGGRSAAAAAGRRVAGAVLPGCKDLPPSRDEKERALLAGLEEHPHSASFELAV